MEQIPTVKERIDKFIQELLDNGFEEWCKEEAYQYTLFYIGTPRDTRMFSKDIITVCVSESANEASVTMNETRFLGKRNFTDFVYG